MNYATRTVYAQEIEKAKDLYELVDLFHCIATDIDMGDVSETEACLATLRKAGPEITDMMLMVLLRIAAIPVESP